VVTGITIALLGGAAYLGLARRDDVIKWALDPNLLLWMIAGLALVALGWVAVVVSSYKMLRPLDSGVGARLFGALAIGLVCCTIASGSALGAQNLVAQRNLVRKVFADGNSKSATRPKIASKEDPWAQLPRLNLLLLGADDGDGRRGARTDTVMVASIDTRTGDTALISLTRNFMRMPFPKDSPLFEKFPTGYWDPRLGNGEQIEYYLDAMYRNIPRDYGDLLGESDNKGADVLKLSVGEALGLKLHYYLQINLSGFEQLVTALDGITVNINYPVPIGGDTKGPGTADDILPSRYLDVGPNQKLNGHDALWFAGGRYNVMGSDIARQERQRCTIKAIVERATPQNVLTHYQEVAQAGEQLIRTDIPQTMLGNLVTLGQQVKSAKISNVDLDKQKNFPNGRNPNYAAMRVIVENALHPTKPSTAVPTPKPATKPTTKTTAKPTKPTEAADLANSCAYHPVPG
jgi:LCP family protein required for cell wall assembly